MAASRKYVTLDHRRRVALGRYARHDLFLLTVSAEGVITLTPAELMPLPQAPPAKRPARKRSPRKAAPAAADKSQEQGVKK